MPTLTDYETLDVLAGQAWRIADEKGWHDPQDRGDGFPRDASATERVMLMVTECAEIVEAIRSSGDPGGYYYGDGGKPEGAMAELADVLIRAFDYAVHHEHDVTLGRAVSEKMAYNAGRPFRHGGKVL